MPIPTGAARFTKINEEFTCVHCGKTVVAAAKTCRNHCPHCLTSLHVDINPGDRANPCGGVMDAVGYELDAKKGIALIFSCRRCGERRRNKANREEPMPDDYEAILRLTPTK